MYECFVPWFRSKWIRINEFLWCIRACIKSSCNPSRFFRRSPSPSLPLFEGMEHCRVTLDERGTKTKLAETRVGSQKEVLACLVPTPLWFLGRLTVAPLLLSGRMLRKNQANTFFLLSGRRNLPSVSIRLARTAPSSILHTETRPYIKFFYLFIL